MVKRADDKSPEPPGGRAAERLRMFEEARGIKKDTQNAKKKTSAKAPKDCPEEMTPDEKQTRRKD